MKSKSFDGRVWELKYVTKVIYMADVICQAKKVCESEDDARVFLNSTMKALRSMNYTFIEATIKVERTLSLDRLEKRHG